MFIEEIELVGYHRLNLNSFKRVHFKFNKIVQVIIGTNGSGKSSIFAELSPMPGEPKNFTKDGKKRIVYRHRGKRYILTSTFDPPRHSFMIEGELDDLNPGATITEQKKLVKQHFGIDANTHQICTGENPFDRMGSEARKECFRLLSDANFDFAISVYNRVKTASRDVIGALKLARNKLVAQTAKMMPREELDALKAECEELYKIVELLIENRNSPTAPLQETDNAIGDMLSGMERDSNLLIRSIREVERLLALNIVDDPKNASNVEYFVNQKLQELRTRRDALYTESKRYQENIELYEKTKLFQVATISTELERLKAEREKLTGQLIYNFQCPEPTEFIVQLEQLAPELTNLSQEISINEKSERFTRDSYRAMVEERDRHRQAIANLSADNRHWEERVAHHDQHKDSPEVTCPKCDHTWQPFYNEHAIAEIKLKIVKAENEISFKTQLIADLEVKIEEFNNWVRHLEAIKDLSRRYGVFNDLWNLILKKEVIYEQPRTVGLILSKYKSDLYAQQAIEKIDQQEREEREKLELASNSQGIDYNNSVVGLKYITDEMHHIANEETRLNAIKDNARSLTTNTRRVAELSSKLANDEKSLDALVERHVEDMRRIMYNNILRSFSSDLAVKEKAINDERLNEGAIKALEQEIKSLEDHSEAYKLVLKELSPTEGIIAEGLFGYMKLFVRKWNRFISTVWTYPLVIQPCSPEEGKLELNYKFPIMVNDSRPESTREDVAKGSSSMREIINLGFVIGYMKSMGLENGQLFLDEFGKAMDPIHKHMTSRMVSTIVENEKFSQIFLISHDVAQYNAVDNAEVCILHEANTIIPPGCVYNKHVEFS
jgi:energy-coupling factor transporter ATP-binding protein EcfA2